ncbi:hypothetical protein [Legionella impletisoli]|uniref:Uncharacterized protein n=1 Tax=Legionella impletisoli TaxID=343510 RepID=A0A917JP49_9GAMM|nr:hypothetical protein [Legionella impletisoli]GGI79291.1 hypothetical protein GCM10007966_04770 [Legionella impletisoli]
MNLFIKISVTLFTLFLTSYSFASDVRFPQILLFNGKPIDPLCFYEAGETHGNVDLSTCGLHSEPGRSITGKNTHLTDKGYFGYDYSWKMEQGASSQGYSYYKPLGMLNQSVIIETLNNSGGTGEFSSLSMVSRNNNQLSINAFQSGDRCNAGINEAKRIENESGDRLVYSINLTPYDFLVLAHDNPHDVKAYDELSACAACCVATAVYERSIGPDFNKEQLLHIQLTVQETNSQEDSFGPKYQACFDNLLQVYQKQYNGKLEPNVLKQLTHEFNRQCVLVPEKNAHSKETNRQLRTLTE